MFKMVINNTSNAAFCDPSNGDSNEYFEREEIARIMADIQESIIFNGAIKNQHHSIHDYNGNMVGYWIWD